MNLPKILFLGIIRLGININGHNNIPGYLLPKRITLLEDLLYSL